MNLERRLFFFGWVSLVITTIFFEVSYIVEVDLSLLPIDLSFLSIPVYWIFIIVLILRLISPILLSILLLVRAVREDIFFWSQKNLELWKKLAMSFSIFLFVPLPVNMLLCGGFASGIYYFSGVDVLEFLFIGLPHFLLILLLVNISCKIFKGRFVHWLVVLCVVALSASIYFFTKHLQGIAC